MTTRIFTLFICISFLTATPFEAQVRTVRSSKSAGLVNGVFNKAARGKETVYQIAPPDVEAVLKKELETTDATEPKPYKFAEALAVAINLPDLLDWKPEGGYVYGKFSFQSTGASSLSFNFDDFYLPKGTEMYIYNKNAKTLSGPITESENNDLQLWGSTVLEGDFITIEIKTPLKTFADMRLHIDNVAYGYKDAFSGLDFGGFGKSAPCNINVLCPLGKSWEKERNSVALILNQNGTLSCTGALVNNAACDGTPYFLTANHCLAATENVSRWRFHFGYWSYSCDTTQDDLIEVALNGAT